jgi:hypothetical protein
MMALAPRTVQNIPDCLSLAPISVLHPAEWDTNSVLTRQISSETRLRPECRTACYMGNPYAGHAAACQQCRYKLPVGYFERDECVSSPETP